MIDLPYRTKAFEYENNFYLTCDNSRIAKFIAQYELYQKVIAVPGDIVECGVFKGASFIRLATFQKLMNIKFFKKLIGFDTFGQFPNADLPEDVDNIEGFFDRAGDQSISKEQLSIILKEKGIEHFDLVEGDIRNTIPEYLKHNNLQISLLNLDCDFYEASRVVLKELYPRLSKGGILMLDNYKDFVGETRAVDEYFGGVKIQRFPYSENPCYIIK